MVLSLRLIYSRAVFAARLPRLPGLCLTGALAYVVAGGLVCSSAQGAPLLERKAT